MVVLMVPSSLRRHTDQQSRITLPGDTVEEALEHFVERSTELRNYLFSGTSLRKFVVVCKNGQDIRILEGLSTPVGGGDEVQLIASIAGG